MLVRAREDAHGRLPHHHVDRLPQARGHALLDEGDAVLRADRLEFRVGALVRERGEVRPEMMLDLGLPFNNYKAGGSP